jgi:hypothetical protein
MWVYKLIKRNLLNNHDEKQTPDVSKFSWTINKVSRVAMLQEDLLKCGPYVEGCDL